MKKEALYDMFYFKALEGEKDCGGILSYNYYSGESITGIPEGRPMVIRKAETEFNLANFTRGILYSTAATLKIGMDILEKEKVEVKKFIGHGGLFKTKAVGQKIMAAALGVPVEVMDFAGEGGAWGIALLARYTLTREKYNSLDNFTEEVFKGVKSSSETPDESDRAGFKKYMDSYISGLEIMRSAIKNF